MPFAWSRGRQDIVRSKRQPPLVLTAHDVFQEDGSPSGVEANIAVGAETLTKTLKNLRNRGYTFVGFAEFIERRHDGNVALLTFDDAYRSVSRVALPVLKAEAVPAVVFVVTGTLFDNADPFPIWLQALRDRKSILEEAAAASLLSDRAIRRVITKSGFATLAELLSRPLGIPTEAFRQTLTQGDLDEIAAAVAALPGIGKMTMTEADIRQLMSSGLVELGAHSVSHRSFAMLADQEIEEEIAGSVAMVAELSGKLPSLLPFAYPYGAVTARAAHYISRTCRAGFTCHARPITRLDPVATLPRVNLDGNAIRNCGSGSLATHLLALTREKMHLHLRSRLAKFAQVGSILR